MKKSCAVIGSGIAGLAVALRLAAKGYKVDVYEQNGQVGGKVNEIHQDGFRFDYGPTVLTMPWLIDDLFKINGKEPRKYFNYNKIEDVTTYFFNDGKVINAASDPEKYAEELEEKVGISKRRFLSFLSDSAEKFRLTKDVFLESSLHQVKNYTRWEAIRGIFLFSRVGAFVSMASKNRRFFNDCYTERILNRYAQYIGSDPYKMSSTFNVIAHVELSMGMYYVEGGMRRFIDAMGQLCKEVGVEIHLNSRVNEIKIKDHRVESLVIGKKEVEYDVVISNADIHLTKTDLLHENVQKNKMRRNSSSALLFFWNVEGTHPQLNAHNFLFGEDCKVEFSDIFDKGKMPEDGAIYLHVGSKLNPEDAPNGCENWFIILNAPTNKAQDWDVEVEKLRKSVIEKMSKLLDEDISKKIKHEKVITPKDIQSTYSSFKGSIYGQNSNSILSAFLRQPNFSSKTRGLYFTGGSVHPGAGIPLCLNSAEITANLIEERE